MTARFLFAGMAASDFLSSRGTHTSMYIVGTS
jgi:hypothetical protein